MHSSGARSALVHANANSNAGRHERPLAGARWREICMIPPRKQEENMSAFKVIRGCVLLVLAASGMSACGATARLTVADGTGARPVLPPPQTSLLPTVNVVTAKGWSGDDKPVAAEGLT